ncbi:MAG: HIT domain-containing protein, partial [Planctomycetota bacterium]
MWRLTASMGRDDCIFCKMVAGQIPVTKIYEDDVVLSFLDIGPVSDGHTLVIPKQHFERLHDCPPELLGRVCSSLGRIAKAVADSMSSQGYNVLCNNG